MSQIPISSNALCNAPGCWLPARRNCISLFSSAEEEPLPCTDIKFTVKSRYNSCKASAQQLKSANRPQKNSAIDTGHPAYACT